MKKKIKYIGALLILLVLGGIINAKPCMAASAGIEISTDTTEVTIGDNIFVYITIDSDTMFGDFEANLTYDDNILEFLSGAPVITGSSGFLKILDTGISQGSSNRKYTLKFEALEVGTCKIAFDRRAVVYVYEDGSEMSVSSNDLTVAVKAAETASANANLKSMKINPSTLTPVFDKNVFVYNAEVSYDTEQLIVDAVPEHEKATVSISGNDFLKEGENKVIVTVLAESGDVIEYTVNVFRESAPEEVTPADDITIAPGALHGTFEVVRIKDEIFAVYGGKYKLIEPDSEVRIPDGYSKNEAILSDIKVNVYTQDMKNDFFLIYAMNELKEAGFYTYDRIEKTMQRYVPEEAYGFDNVVTSPDKEIIQSDEYRANLNKAAIVIALLCIICVLLIAVLIRLYMKLRGFHEDDLD